MLTNSSVRETLLSNEEGIHSATLSSAEPEDDEVMGIRNFSLFQTIHSHKNNFGKRERNHGQKFPKNIIVTSRYTIFSFLPKSLFEQFRRLANVYFLIIGMIAVVGEYAKFYPTSLMPVGILGPMILVIFISIIKEAVEDFKRHRQDAKLNAKMARCVDENGDVIHCKWKDLEVGSVLLVFGNEELPADCTTLLCGGIQGDICYVETAAIDGETNLKIRNPAITADTHKVKVPQDKRRVLGLNDLNISVSAEAPNGSIHRFNGSIEYINSSRKVDPSAQALDGLYTRNALSNKHLLLRGSVLRATEWCLCVVTYTGRDTKLSLNSKSTPSKLSSIDHVVNKTLLVAISGMLLVCLISMLSNLAWISLNSDAYYLCIYQSDEINGVECDSSAPNSILTIFTFATLYNNFVCISMYVSLEMVYLFQAYFISNDITLYDQSTDTPAAVHSSGMCADLGQVQYVLSDKTGTLTQNLMELRRVCVLDRVFGEPVVVPGTQMGNVNGSLSTQDDNDDHNAWSEIGDLANINSRVLGSLQDKNRVAEDLFRVFVACNTVLLMPDVKTGYLDVRNPSDLRRVLQAESPDEVALVLAVAEHGNVLLQERDSRKIKVTGLKSHGRVESEGPCIMTILAVNEFESNRKRMSVIVKCEDGRILLLCKGADSTTLPRCKVHTQTSDFCIRQVDIFASTGLRTLVFSRREISEQELEKFMVSYEIASNSLTHREELLAQCADEIERDMELLGAVGIEDKLQEGVSESISTLQSMGMNVWMITGDKPETAVAISKISNLLRPEHHVEKIVGFVGEPLQKKLSDLLEMVRKIKKDAADQRRSEVRLQSIPSRYETHDSGITNPALFGTDTLSLGQSSLSSDKSSNVDQSSLALVIDGVSLEAIWLSKNTRNVFTDIVRNVKTVVACRVSPLQKATLVRMIKRDPSRPVTLAIGDGANDVGMIHEAKVGVGISGREGKHAANSSDFAIGQFRFLVPLLLEHGRFNYIRCSKLVLYSFFKNLVLVSSLFYYCIYSGFSGTMPIDSLVFGGYNFYLGVPIIILGAFDFDVPRMSVYKFPYLAYATGRNGELLNIATMGRYCVLAFLEGMILFAVIIRFIGGTVRPKPTANDEKMDIAGIGLNNSDGEGGGIYVDGFLLFSCVVMAMQTKVIFMGYTANWISWVCWTLSILGFYFFNLVYGQIPDLDCYHVTEFSIALQDYWLAIIVAVVIITEMDYVVECFFSILYPTSRDILVMQLESNERHQSAPHQPVEESLTYSGDWIAKDKE